MRWGGVLVVLAVAACRSPFADSDETGPPEDPQKVGVGVHGWPLYERAPGSKGVRTDVLWPVASVRTSETGELRRADVLVPIVLWERDGTRSRFGVRPLFDVETDDAVGAAVEDVDLLWPLVKWREEPEESRFEVRPFWWHLCTPEQRRNILFPLFGEWECGDRGGWFAGPLGGGTWNAEESFDWWMLGAVSHECDAGVEDGNSGTDSWKVLYGVLESTSWDDGAQQRLFPLLWHGEDESRATDEWLFLWPGLAGSRREGDHRQSWVAPLWYRDCDSDSSTTVVVPFWFEHETAEGAFRLLFPLYGRHVEGAYVRHLYGGNLFWTSENGATGEATADVLWPLVHWGCDPEGWDARLVPFVWLDRHGENAHTHLWPLFGHRRSGDETELSVAWPLCMYEEDEKGWNAHVFPLVWLDRHAEHEHTHLWPLYGHSRDGTESEHSVAWLFFTVESDTDGWEADLPWPLVEIDRRGTHHETRVWPLWSSECDTDTGAYEGDVLWLLSNWEGDGGEKHDFRILWRLVQSTDTGEKTVFAVNPFFRHETNDRGDDHWSALFGLVARTREADDVDWRLLWFIHL